MRQFVADMPPPATQHERMKSRLHKLPRKVEQRPDSDVAPQPPAPEKRGPER